MTQNEQNDSAVCMCVYIYIYLLWASQVALVVKNQPANTGDIREMGSIPASGRSPGGGHGNPFQYSCLENPHGQRSLEGYSAWGHKESDRTERLTHRHTKSHH